VQEGMERLNEDEEVFKVLEVRKKMGLGAGVVC